VLRARWIARGRADAIKLFLDELLVVKCFGAISPKLGAQLFSQPTALMKILSYMMKMTKYS
jgi:transposase InsO family protein